MFTRLSLCLQSKSIFFTFGVHNNLWKNMGVDPPGPLWTATLYYLGVSYGGLAIYNKKYLKAKEEL
jgi:hypothetical protein